MRAPPPPAVLEAFGADGEPVPLTGGQGGAFRAGEVVLKPLDRSQEELAWQASLLSGIRCDGFRVARPLRADGGVFSVDGWCAAEHVEGRHEQGRWVEIVAVGERFHRALRGAARPAFLDRREDPWAIGDRVAFGELPAAEFAHVKHVPRLLAALRPLGEPSQLVHGDLTGNVLFASGLPPAVIDLSPYFRPAGFASAVVVADALVWEGAGEDLLRDLAAIPNLAQHLLRALVYRAVTDRLIRPDDPPRPADADPYLPAVELALRLTGPP